MGDHHQPLGVEAFRQQDHGPQGLRPVGNRQLPLLALHGPRAGRAAGGIDAHRLSLSQQRHRWLLLPMQAIEHEQRPLQVDGGPLPRHRLQETHQRDAALLFAAGQRGRQGLSAEVRGQAIHLHKRRGGQQGLMQQRRPHGGLQAAAHTGRQLDRLVEQAQHHLPDAPVARPVEFSQIA